MERGEQPGVCERCHAGFGYRLVHNGFSDSAYAYCDLCGRTCWLDGWRAPAGVPLELHREITPAVEPYLLPCECGGAFKAGAAPRCPHCMHSLSAEAAAVYIERNAPGTAKGYRWQRSWSGLYCMVVDGRGVTDPWRAQTAAEPSTSD